MVDGHPDPRPAELWVVVDLHIDRILTPAPRTDATTGGVE
jgi:hypothetical protein